MIPEENFEILKREDDFRLAAPHKLNNLLVFLLWKENVVAGIQITHSSTWKLDQEKPEKIAHGEFESKEQAIDALWNLRLEIKVH